MNSTPIQFAEMQRSQLDALSALGGTLCDATEKLANLHFAATRALLQEAAEASQNLLASKDAPTALAVAGGFVQPAAERLMSYSRDAYEIASGANAELSKIVEAQVGEGGRKIVEWIEIALKSAPAGSQVAVSFLKDTYTASSSAYESVSSAAKQAFGLAETSFDVTTGTATAAVKPKARKAA